MWLYVFDARASSKKARQHTSLVEQILFEALAAPHVTKAMRVRVQGASSSMVCSVPVESTSVPTWR